MNVTMRERTQKELDALPDSVFAVVNGEDRSFPIENEADLRNAIQAYGRAADKPAAKAGITRRAKALKLTDLLPADWEGSTKEASEIIARATAKAFSLPAGMTYNNLNELLSSELNEDFGGGNSYEVGGGRLWIRDFDDQYVVYENRDGSLTRRPYAITAGNDVQWGQPEEVSAQTAYMPVAGSETQAFASKRHSAKDQQHIDQAAHHLLHAGANPPGGWTVANTPSQQQINNQMREAYSVQMTEDANLRSAPFTLPEWFSEGAGADAMPEWLPFLPVPHDFAHPSYGTVSITPERIGNFVTQFNAGVYQQSIPLDAEHGTKASGALAWVNQLRVNEDGSADAKVAWTPRGEQMYRDGAFKYISPEWYDEWTDPATGQTYQDVAIGGALTTRPFFKSPYLRPLAANESGDGDSRDMPHAGERSHGMTATPETVSPAQFTELESKFTELSGKFTESEAARQAAEAERDSYKETVEKQGESIAALEKDARTKRFTEQAREWPGDAATHLSLLETLATTFGEDSDAFKGYVTQQKAATEQVRMAAKTGNIFREVGSAHSGASGAAGQVESMAVERAKEKGITIEKARTQIYNEHPELAQEQEAEQRSA